MDIYDTCHFCCSGLIPTGGPGFASLVKGQQHETDNWVVTSTDPSIISHNKGLNVSVMLKYSLKASTIQALLTILFMHVNMCHMTVVNRYNGAAGSMAKFEISQIPSKIKKK